MTPSEVLRNLDSSMAMKSGDWLEEQLHLNEKPLLIDLRGKDLWNKGHIPGSIQLNIQDLPDNASRIIPSKETVVICICNGSVQSAMAAVFLRTEDYYKTYNLSGGYSAWVRNGKPIE